MESDTMTITAAAEEAALPSRLHHTAWVVEDQERTRAFYEDVLGLPLVAFWIESEPFEGDNLVISHSFYGLQDGSALAFFSMAEDRHHERFKSPKTEMFNHIALTVEKPLQRAMKERMDQSGVFNFEIEHGYCHSLYVTDPDGLRLEFAVDAEDAAAIDADQRASAHESLKRWAAGDRTSNNTLRG